LRFEKEVPETRTLEVNANIVECNAYIIHFSNNEVYSISSKKFFELGGTYTVTFKNLEYVKISYDNKHMIYHYKTAKLLYTLDIDPNVRYTFERYTITVEDLVEGEYELRKVYRFDDYEPIEEDLEFKPIDLSNYRTIKEYAYKTDTDGITVYKNGKFYAYYYYEENHTRTFYLPNGNMLFYHEEELDADAEEYDFNDGYDKYNYYYLLYDLAAKKIKKVALPIIINNIVLYDDAFGFIKVDAGLDFNAIDPKTKMLTRDRIGSINNDLKIKEINFEFGEMDDFYAYHNNRFLIISREAGAFLVDGKNNKIISSFEYDKYLQLTPLPGETVALYDDYNEKIHIYSLETGKAIHSEYDLLGIIDTNILLLEKDDKYYRYDGSLHLLDGKPIVLEYGNVPMYIIERDDGYDYYMSNGVKLFKAADANALVKRDYIFEDMKTFYIFSYTVDGVIKHCIVERSQFLMVM
jgi:hypothetical protein